MGGGVYIKLEYVGSIEGMQFKYLTVFLPVSTLFLYYGVACLQSGAIEGQSMFFSFIKI